jgi:glycosyltransferase involved in cell wall biosynthesis
VTPRSARHDTAGDRGPRILHLDHTSSAGGAEYALARMLQASPPWQPMLLLARTGLGAYAPLSHLVPLQFTGVRQRAGASSGGVQVVLDATARLLVQAAAVRIHPGFRSADLIDANTARAAAYGALAARTRRVPFVVHLRDMTDADALGPSGLATMTRLVLPRADGVIANSRATLASAAPWLRADAATAVIPSASGLTHAGPARAREAGEARGVGGGVGGGGGGGGGGGERAEGVADVESAAVSGGAADVADVGHGSEPLVVGMLARIDPWKGQDLLLEAFTAALGDRAARLQFAGAPLFGHTDFADRLRARAEMSGVADRVDFLGHVDDVSALLETWDVAVHYSTRPEPLGQNVLQYLAAGASTIVADEGGPTEWVEDGVNGLRAKPRDIRSLSDALARLASSPELRARLGAAAMATPGLLDDHEVAMAHADFYAQVLSHYAQNPGTRTRRRLVE